MIIINVWFRYLIAVTVLITYVMSCEYTCVQGVVCHHSCMVREDLEAISACLDTHANMV